MINLNRVVTSDLVNVVNVYFILRLYRPSPSYRPSLSVVRPLSVRRLSVVCVVLPFLRSVRPSVLPSAPSSVPPSAKPTHSNDTDIKLKENENFLVQFCLSCYSTVNFSFVQTFKDHVELHSKIHDELEKLPCLYRDTKQEGIENAICHFLAILHSCSQNRQTVPSNHAV